MSPKRTKSPHNKEFYQKKKKKKLSHTHKHKHTVDTQARVRACEQTAIENQWGHEFKDQAKSLNHSLSQRETKHRQLCVDRADAEDKAFRLN